MRRVLAAAGLALLFSVGAGAATAEDVCALDRLDLRGGFGEARFTVEVADDDHERPIGLMNRESIAAAQGMLFVYPAPGMPAFWMKNTLIPLDMIFITPQGVVQYVHEMAQPGDLTPIRGGNGVLAVLEIKGGLARAIGIAPGDVIRHPAFGPEAAWSCDE